MQWVIHEGEGIEAYVQFDWVRGDVEKARYIWNARDIKSRAFVRSQYYGTLVDPYTIAGTPLSGWALRDMHVDFGEFADKYTGGDPEVEEDILNMLIARGWVAVQETFLNATILDATISPTSQWRYRQHYNIGDIVYVRGNYEAESAM